jgi:signal peptidase I
MDGSGARDGHGSPPWDPADPVPDPGDQGRAPTQEIRGLGAIRGPSGHRPGRGARDSASRDSASRDSAASGPTVPANGPPAPGGSPAEPAGRPAGEDGQEDGSQEEEGQGAADGKRHRSFWKELPILVVIAIVLALIIKSFAVQAFYIPSSSMENTLDIGDRVLINKIVYHLRPIHRGDIVVFDGTGSWDFDNPTHSTNIFSKAVDELEGIVGITTDTSIYIKRVIGLPGDHVACCNTKGQVTVNGVPLTEGSYVYPGEAPSTQKFSITVPAGRLWVMGDHRLVSYDSRGHLGDPGGGTIPVTGVLGRAFVIIWPPSRWGVLNIPATFEQPKLNSSTAAGGAAAGGGGGGAAVGEETAVTAAIANGTPVQPSGSPLPLALGFAGAVPLTWLNRRLWLRRPHRPAGRSRRRRGRVTAPAARRGRR